MAKNLLEWVSMLLKEVTCAYVAPNRKNNFILTQKRFIVMNKLSSKTKARLANVSDSEWLDAIDQVKRLIAWRLFGSKANGSGAHSEMVLGMPAEDYYVGEAI